MPRSSVVGIRIAFACSHDVHKMLAHTAVIYFCSGIQNGQQGAPACSNGELTALDNRIAQNTVKGRSVPDQIKRSDELCWAHVAVSRRSLPVWKPLVSTTSAGATDPSIDQIFCHQYIRSSTNLHAWFHDHGQFVVHLVVVACSERKLFVNPVKYNHSVLHL